VGNMTHDMARHDSDGTFMMLWECMSSYKWSWATLNGLLYKQKEGHCTRVREFRRIVHGVVVILSYS